MTNNFQTTFYGKWILSGEHAVLRGHPVIVFPLKNKQLHFSYIYNEDEIRAEFSGEYGEEIQFLFWSALERAIEILNIHHNDLNGKVLIENHIPVGSGMGASGALCVAIGRWLQQQGYIVEANLFEFSRQLENLFHGESSGADIAVAIAGSGIYFSRSGAMRPVKKNWSPIWYSSYSDKPSPTSRCVKQVKEFWERDPKLAHFLDLKMAESVRIAEESLACSQPEKALPLLVKAVQQGYECFKAWGLTQGFVDNHINQLKKAGALAAKPSGSGGGGYIISIWDKKPPAEIAASMLRLE